MSNILKRLQEAGPFKAPKASDPRIEAAKKKEEEKARVSGPFEFSVGPNSMSGEPFAIHTSDGYYVSDKTFEEFKKYAKLYADSKGYTIREFGFLAGHDGQWLLAEINETVPDTDPDYQEYED